MLRSTFCILHELSPAELYDLNECPYDSGGYFIINGSEKVLIAQERMATNHVYVFAKAQPSPINFLAEIRSAVEKGGKTISQFQVKMFHRSQEKTVGSSSSCSSALCTVLNVNSLETSSKRLFRISKLTSQSGSSFVHWVLCLTATSSSIFATTCRTRPCWRC